LYHRKQEKQRANTSTLQKKTLFTQSLIPHAEISPSIARTYPYQTIHMVSQTNQSLITKPCGCPGGYAVINKQDGTSLDVPGFEQLWF